MNYKMMDDGEDTEEIEELGGAWHRIGPWKVKGKSNAVEIQTALENEGVDVGNWNGRPNFECAREGCEMATIDYLTIYEHLEKVH